jgi:hypothetical protein
MPEEPLEPDVIPPSAARAMANGEFEILVKKRKHRMTSNYFWSLSLDGKLLQSGQEKTREKARDAAFDEYVATKTWLESLAGKGASVLDDQDEANSDTI